MLNFKWLRWHLGVRLQGKWHPALGTDDMRDAYRRIPNKPQQERFCGIAVRTGRKGQGRVRFDWVRLWGKLPPYSRPEGVLRLNAYLDG